METAVTKSGTLSLVEPFLVAHQPVQFARDDYKHSQGRPKEWLIRLKFNFICYDLKTFYCLIF